MFRESQRSLKSISDEHKISVKNCDYDKREIAKNCWKADYKFSWDKKKNFDREGGQFLERSKKLCII